MNLGLTITKENHPDWYEDYHQSFSAKVEKAIRIVGILETVSNKNTRFKKVINIQPS